MVKHPPLIVISIDALNDLDYDFISKLPTFKTFIEQGCVIRDVRSIYPSVTYPCHTSIITGTYPDKHGIYNNEFAEPSRPLKQHWRWHERNIKVPTLFDYARQAGLKTANIFWPVLADAPIDYNIPEIWSVDGDSSFITFWNNGSRKLLPLVLKYKHLLNGTSQPGVDNFSEAVTHVLLKKKHPDFLCLHFTELDSMRHYHGLHTPFIDEILVKIDARLSRLLATIKSIPYYKDANLILLGDHGGSDFKEVIDINGMLQAAGLDFVYACSAGGSTQLHLLHKTPEELEKQESDIQKLEAFIENLLLQPNTGISQHFTKEDVHMNYHLTGDFHCILEAKDGYIFRNAVALEDYKLDHGYLPSHPHLRTLFFAMGPAFQSGVTLSSGISLVDEGPTLAHALGLTMEKVDGRVVHEILKEQLKEEELL